MVSFWSLSSNPNLKKGALSSYQDIHRFDWEKSHVDEMQELNRKMREAYPKGKLKFVDG